MELNAGFLSYPGDRKSLKMLLHLQQIYSEWEEIGLAFQLSQKLSHSGPQKLSLFSIPESTWRKNKSRSMKSWKILNTSDLKSKDKGALSVQVSVQLMFLHVQIMFWQENFLLQIHPSVLATSSLEDLPQPFSNVSCLCYC